VTSVWGAAVKATAGISILKTQKKRLTYHHYRREVSKNYLGVVDKLLTKLLRELVCLALAGVGTVNSPLHIRGHLWVCTVRENNATSHFTGSIVVARSKTMSERWDSRPLLLGKYNLMVDALGPATEETSNCARGVLAKNLEKPDPRAEQSSSSECFEGRI
jgi:hypothetical protein